jgi:hypothetical protein
MGKSGLGGKISGFGMFEIADTVGGSYSARVT